MLENSNVKNCLFLQFRTKFSRYSPFFLIIAQNTIQKIIESPEIFSLIPCINCISFSHSLH